MHQLGYAHSVETYIDGELAGGLYGMALGQAFLANPCSAGAPMPPRSPLPTWRAFLSNTIFAC
jgi:hypothetical protein